MISQGHIAGKWQNQDLNPWLFGWKVHTLYTLSAYESVISYFKQRESDWQQISGFSFFFSPAALSNSKGEFLLNGDFVVTMSKREIRLGNAVIEYSGSDNVVERINCTDRIEQELLLQVKTWLRAHNPFLPLGITGPANILSVLSAYSRCCR